MADGDTPDFQVDPIVPQSSDPPPSTTTTPTPTPTPSAPKEESSGQGTTSADDFYKQMVDHYKRADEYMKKQEQTLAPLYEQLQKSMEQPLPQMPKLQALPQAPDQRANAQALEKGRMEYLAIALPLAFMLGRKGRNASWLAMGAFGQGLAQLGQQNHAAAQEQYKNWQEAVKNVQEQNKEQMDQYKEILENRKLTLEQQMSLIGVIAQQYGNTVLHEDTQAKNATQMGYHLAQQEEKAKQFDQKTEDLKRHWLEFGKNNPEGAAYQSFMKTKYGIDPYASQDDYDEAQKKFSFNKWDAEYQHQKATHGDEEAGDEDPLGLKTGNVDQSGAQKTLQDIGILGE